MAKGTFYYETYIDKGIEEVWEYFSTAENLAKITAFPKVKILSDPKTAIGNTIKMELHFGVFRLNWNSDITDLKDHLIL